MRRIVPLNLVGLGTTAADLARDLETASDGEIKIKVYGPGKLVPAEEIFPALEKGVIDATEFSMPAIDERLGLYKILKYNYWSETMLQTFKDKWQEVVDEESAKDPDCL